MCSPISVAPAHRSSPGAFTRVVVIGSVFASAVVGDALLPAARAASSTTSASSPDVVTVLQSDGAGAFQRSDAAVAVDDDGHLIAACDSAGRVTIWDLHSRLVLRSFATGQFPVDASLAFARGGTVLMVTTMMSVSSWDTLTGRKLSEQKRNSLSARIQQGEVSDLIYDTSATHMAAGDAFQTSVGVVGDPKRQFLLPHGAQSLAFDRAGRRAFLVQGDGVRAVDTATGKLTATFSFAPADTTVGRLAVDRAGARIALQRRDASYASAIEVREVAKPDVVVRIEGGSAPTFDEAGGLLYLDAKACFRRRAPTGKDSALPLPCLEQLSEQQRVFRAVAPGLVWIERLLLRADDGTVVADFAGQTTAQKLVDADDVRGAVDVAVLRDLQIERPLHRLLRPQRVASGGVMRWDLRTGRRDTIGDADALGTNAGACTPPAGFAAFEGFDHVPIPTARFGARAVAVDAKSIHVCDRATGAWQFSVPRATTTTTKAPDRPVVVSLLTDDVVEIYDAALAQERWDLTQRKRVSLTPGPAEKVPSTFPLLRAFLRKAPLAYFAATPNGLLVEEGGKTRPLFTGWVHDADKDPARERAAIGTSGGLVLVDQKGETKTVDTGGKDVVRVVYGTSGRVFAQTADGDILVVDVAAGAILASLVAAGDDGDVIVLPDGTYAASRGALSVLGGQRGLRAVPFSEFDLGRNRPDVVLARLGFASPADLAAASALHAQRLRRHGFDDDKAPSALIALDVKAPPPLWTTTRKLPLSFTLAAPMTGTLRLFINDVPLDDKGVAVAGDRVSTTVWLSSGANRVQAFVEGKDGSRSSSWQAWVHTDVAAAPARVFFLGVGVADYAQDAYDLAFSAKDVRDVERSFAARHGKAFVSRLLVDGGATAAAVRSASAWLKKARIDDTVILYIAGHGLRVLQDPKVATSPSEYFFAPHDMDFAAPATRGLTFADLEDLLRASPARQRLMFMDTCQAGESSGGEPLVTRPRNENGVSARAPRVLSASTSVAGSEVSLALPARGTRLEDQFADLRLNSGAHVIAAAGAAEFALESGTWNNGVFTYSVLKTLASKDSDVDDDGTVTMDELRRGVAHTVSALTGGQQVPTHRQENLALAIPVARAVPLSITETPGAKIGAAAVVVTTSDGKHRVVFGAHHLQRGDVAGKKELARVSLAEVSCRPRSPDDVASNADGTRLVFSCDDALWLVDVGAHKSRKIGAASNASTLALDDAGRWLVVHDSGGASVQVYDATKPNLPPRPVKLSAYRGWPLALGLERGGVFVLVSTEGGVTRIDAAAATELEAFSLPLPAQGEASTTTIAWPDGVLQFPVLDARHGLYAQQIELRTTAPIPTTTTTALAVAPPVRDVIVWDLKTRAVRVRLDAARGLPVGSARQGTWLALRSLKGVQWVDVRSGLEVAWLSGARGASLCAQGLDATLDGRTTMCGLGHGESALVTWTLPTSP